MLVRSKRFIKKNRNLLIAIGVAITVGGITIGAAFLIAAAIYNDKVDAEATCAAGKATLDELAKLGCHALDFVAKTGCDLYDCSGRACILNINCSGKPYAAAEDFYSNAFQDYLATHANEVVSDAETFSRIRKWVFGLTTITSTLSGIGTNYLLNKLFPYHPDYDVASTVENQKQEIEAPETYSYWERAKNCLGSVTCFGLFNREPQGGQIESVPNDVVDERKSTKIVEKSSRVVVKKFGRKS